MPQIKPTIDSFIIFPVVGGNVGFGRSLDCGEEASATITGGNVPGYTVPVGPGGYFSFALPPEAQGNFSATVTTKQNVVSDQAFFFLP